MTHKYAVLTAVSIPRELTGDEYAALRNYGTLTTSASRLDGEWRFSFTLQSDIMASGPNSAIATNNAFVQNSLMATMGVEGFEYTVTKVSAELRDGC